MNNPFVTAPRDRTKAGGRSIRRRAGRERPPFPAYDLQELDKYYSQQAGEVVVKSQSAADNRRQPENLEVGFLDSEPASLSALVSGQIDWFRTRVVNEDGRNKLKFFRHSDPLQMPLGSDSLSSSDLPHLLFLVDSSSSMGFNPTSPHSNSRGKYDLVLLSCYGILKYIEDRKLTGVQAACINFSGGCIESGWHPVSGINRSNNLHKFKQVLLTYQAGGTTLDTEVVHRVFQSRPGRFLAIAVTDGGLNNTAEAALELETVVESNCSLVLLHVGEPNAFTKTVEEMNCPVYILKSGKDLVGLSLRIAKENFESYDT
jgi:hypothetical protein